MCDCFYINSNGEYVDCKTGEVHFFTRPPKNSIVFDSYEQFLNSTASYTPEKNQTRKSFFNLFKKNTK